ncbi:MAG: hypothetical protein NW203_11810 [Hyphomonadaceae bacterium]|nr:hypothetical protein [Hyphomonadaceae bacterium]
MSIGRAIAVVATLADHGVVRSYAITGAVAALIYIEPFLTEDLDILVSIDAFDGRPSGLVLLSPIEAALADMGYRERLGPSIVVEGWPLQFIPVASTLDEEALRDAIDVEIAAAPSVTARVLRAEHLVAKAISVGRLKDLARVDTFLDQQKVDLQALRAVIDRFDLRAAWATFCMKSGRIDPLR